MIGSFSLKVMWGHLWSKESESYIHRKKYYCPESMLGNGPSQHFPKCNQFGRRDPMLTGAHQWVSVMWTALVSPVTGQTARP